MSVLDLVVGGGIVLTGTVVTQWVAAWIPRSQRREARKIAAAEYEQRCLTELQHAAREYRTGLHAYHEELDASPSVTTATDRQLRHARMNYQALLHRVHPEVVKLSERWEAIAIDWLQGEGSEARENTAWNAVMRECGQRQRAALLR